MKNKLPLLILSIGFLAACGTGAQASQSSSQSEVAPLSSSKIETTSQSKSSSEDIASSSSSKNESSSSSSQSKIESSSSQEPAHTHEFSNDWTKNEEGHWHASSCGHDVKDSYAAHTFDAGKIKKDATCLDKGTTTYVCITCGYEKDVQDIDAKGHSWDDGKVVSGNNCDEPGTKIYTCGECGETRSETLEVVGHTWDEGKITKEPTCHEKGEFTYTCTVCSETRVNDIEMLKHSWNEGMITTPSGCEEEGVKTYTCVLCGDEKLEAVDPTGHSYSNEWSKDESKHWHAASCGHDLKSDEADHDFGEGVVKQEASCSANSILTYTCSTCGYEKDVENNDTLEHSWNDGAITKESSCGTDGRGEKTYTCSECGTTRIEYLDALEHTWNEGVVTKEWSEEGNGIRTFTCSECGETKADAILGGVTLSSNPTDYSLERTDEEVYFVVKGTYGGVVSAEDLVISSGDSVESVFTKQASSFEAGEDGTFSAKFALNSINYHSGLYTQYTLKPAIFAFGVKKDIALIEDKEAQGAVNKTHNASYKLYSENGAVAISWCNNYAADYDNNGNKGLNFLARAYDQVLRETSAGNVIYTISGWTRTLEEAQFVVGNASKYTLENASTTSQSEHVFACMPERTDYAEDPEGGYKVNLTFDVTSLRDDARSMIVGLKYDGMWYEKREDSSTYGGNDGLLKLNTVNSHDAGHDWLYYYARYFYGWVELKGSWVSGNPYGK